MASSSARSLSNNPNRRSQRSSGNKSSDRVKPKKQESGFFDGLKSIVTGPLSWFGGIGKEQADSDEENNPGHSFSTGSKRPAASSQKERGGSPVAKRMRRGSPGPSPNAGQPGLGGYLDPPEVLKDSTSAPNVPSSQRHSRYAAHLIEVGFADVFLHRLPLNHILQQPSVPSLHDTHLDERKPYHPMTSAFGLGSAVDQSIFEVRVLFVPLVSVLLIVHSTG